MATKTTKHPVKKTKKQVKRQRMLTVIGVVLAVFLVIFGAGAIWGHGLGSSSKPEKIADALKGVGQIAAVDYTYTSVEYYQGQDSFYGWQEAKNLGNFTVSYEGVLRMYSDTSALTADSIKQEGKTLTITIPAIKVQSHEIDQSSLSVWDSQDKKWRSITGLTQFQAFCENRKDVDVQQATERGIQSTAQTRVTQMIQAVVGQMGKYETVEVKFA